MKRRLRGTSLAVTIGNKCLKKPSLKLFVTETRPTHNKNSKNQKGAITFAAHCHNVNVLLNNSTFFDN